MSSDNSDQSDSDSIDRRIDDKLGGNVSDSSEFDSDSEYSSDEEGELIIGIDLGTTHSCVGVWRKRSLEIIPDELGRRTIPSMVSFTSRTTYIGHEAYKQTRLNPEHTYYDSKRLIGRRFDDPEVKKDLQFMTFGLGKDEDDNIRMTCDLNNRKKSYTPEEISALILMKLKHQAEAYLKQEVTKAVVTVPAYFTDAQREATRDAIEISQMECVRILNEPTAAALAYGLEKRSLDADDEINVVVYDLGGGTLDVSLLTIADGTFEVIAATGNTHLGGEDFDHRMMEYCITMFKRRHKIKSLNDVTAVSIQKLKQACESAKKLLSTTTKTSIMVPDFYDGKSLFLTMTREKFEYICRDLLILCLKPLEDVLLAGKMQRDDIDEVILVGGATRMKKIRDNIKLFFSGLEPNTNINPDEVVAAGAAIQAYIMGHRNSAFADSVLLLDIIPLSLGVETIGGVMNVLVPRNMAIPITRRKKYTTDQDYVTEIDIKVFEGERKMTRDNFKVGEFVLTGIEEGPRGLPEIEVTFAIDINGIISVTAIDMRNKDNENKITINSNKGRLTKDDIQQLVEEAKTYALQDKLERDKKQTYYEIDDLCSNIKINLKNPDFKLKEKDKVRISEEMELLDDWMEDKPFIERSIKELSKIVKKIKKKYGTLILKVNTDGGDVKGNELGDNVGTTVFGNEEDEETAFEKLTNEEFGISDEMTEEEVRELRELKQSIVDLCYNVVDVLDCDTITIKKEHADELKEYVDDVLLWTHVTEKIKKSEYQQKLNEINNTCNKVTEEYNSKQIFSKDDISSKIATVKDELEQMCYALKSCIMSNYFSIDEKQIQLLSVCVDETLSWLVAEEVEKAKCEEEKKEYKTTEADYRKRLDTINELCNEMYQSMLNINIGTKSIFADDDVVIMKQTQEHDHADEDHKYGTSIEKLKERKSTILEQVSTEISEEEKEEKQKKDPGGTSLEKLKELAQQRKLEKKKESAT